MKTAFLVTPKAELSGFTFQSDRDYFSRPVHVQIVGDRPDGLVTVTDPRRGHTYPAMRANLKKSYQLTAAQREQLA